MEATGLRLENLEPANYRHRSKPSVSFANVSNCRPNRVGCHAGKQYSNYNINKYVAPDLMGLKVCRVTTNQRQWVQDRTQCLYLDFSLSRKRKGSKEDDLRSVSGAPF